MARVNIEERFFGESRLSFAAEMLGEKIVTVTGILVHLWHDSQEELKLIGTRKEIIRWCRYSFDEAENNKLIRILVDSRYISPTKDDQFLIHGNEAQIESRMRRFNASVKGGKRTKEKWEKTKALLNLGGARDVETSQDSFSESNPPDDRGQSKLHKNLAEGGPIGLVVAGHDRAVTRPNSIQCNSIQCNSEKEEVNPQDFGKEEAKPPMPSANAPGSPPSIGSRSKIPKIWEERITGFDRQMADKWMAFSKEQIPTGRFNLLQFQVAIARMRHDFNLDQEKIEQLLEWIRHDDFWSTNAISPMESLRRKNGICKLERILVAMDAPPRAASSSRAQNQPLKPPNQRMLDAIKAGEETVAKWLRGEVEPIRDDEDLGVLA